jgi:hypothetical protein
MRVPKDRLEPRYAAVYAAHLQDELRHVQIDRHLIERFYGRRSMIVRRMTARLFRTIVRRLLLTPLNSTMSVVERLVSEYTLVGPLLPRIRRELRALETDEGYHDMMYSRGSTPITFALFDRFEEFHQMRHVLRAYRPNQ